MSIYENRLRMIHPPVFEDLQGIEACFTLKSADLVRPDRPIPGLNLGSGTVEESSVIRKNRDRLFEELDINPEWVAFGEQVHSTRTRFVTEGGTYPGTDGLVTRVPGLVLAIQVADCAAILMGDPGSDVVSAVHAGWRGAAGEILPASIELMKEEGADPASIRVYVSPCISQENFEVGEEVAMQFPEQFVDRSSYRKPHVDLKSYLQFQMTENGIHKDHIEIDERCTVDENEHCYSYRREGDRSGRMLGLIRIKK